jgi:hypothetical protein
MMRILPALKDGSPECRKSARSEARLGPDVTSFLGLHRYLSTVSKPNISKEKVIELL